MAGRSAVPGVPWWSTVVRLVLGKFLPLRKFPASFDNKSSLFFKDSAISLRGIYMSVAI